MKLHRPVAFVLASLMLFCLPAEGRKAKPAAVEAPQFWNMDGLRGIKDDPSLKRYVDACVSKAEEAIANGPACVVGDTAKLTPDPHYFFAMGKYFWPDPKNPGGPYVNRDGLVNPESKKYDTVKQAALKTNVVNLALAFYFTGDERYYDEYVRHIRAWFIDKDTFMYPNLTYAQVIPGRYDGMGQPAGVIHGYVFTAVLDSYRLVNSVKPVDSGTTAALRSWFAELVKWMLTSDIGVRESKTTNNHSVAYDVMIADFALFARDMDTFNRITDNFRSSRLETQVREDGSMPRELGRTQALGYSVYNLTHFVDFCLMQEKQGRHYYSENRDIIDKVFLFLEPYIGNREAWTYQDINNSFDKDCRALKKQIQRLRQLPDGGHPVMDFEKYKVNGKGPDNYM